MRLMVLFDLPTTSAADKKSYTRFRRFLLKDGYTMVQYSFYVRLCNGTDGVEKHKKRLRQSLPPKGVIQAMVVTDKQYARIELLVGKPDKKDDIKNKFEQLTFF